MTKEEYLEAVKNTFESWINCHHTYEGWLKEWFQTDEYDLTEYCSEILDWRIEAKGDIRTLDYDIRELAYVETAKRMQPRMVRCPECGQMDEFSSYCDCDVDELEDVSAEEIEGWLNDIGAENLITNEDLEACLRVVFDDYYNQVRPFTEPIKEEIEENLSELMANPTDEALAWANHLMHVSGNMLQDYGEQFGLEWVDIQAVSDKGLSYFGEEE